MERLEGYRLLVGQERQEPLSSQQIGAVECFGHELSRCVFGLRGAGHSTVGVHPGIYIGLKVEDAPSFYELWPITFAAHHCQSLVGIACVL